MREQLQHLHLILKAATKNSVLFLKESMYLINLFAQFII